MARLKSKTLENLTFKINITEIQHTLHMRTSKVPPIVAFGKSTVTSLECGML